MKKEIVSIFTVLVFLLLSCNLPPDPTKNPTYAYAQFTTIDGVKPRPITDVKANVEVSVGFNLFLPHFIDSIKISLFSIRKELEAQFTLESPWEGEDLTTPVTFPKPGTKTGIITCFKNNGTIDHDTLIFFVSYPAGNHPPLWTPDTLKLLSMEGLSTKQNLAPYAKDPDNNPLSFEISLPTSDFTAKDSIITVNSTLQAGNYNFRVIISDGELQDTGTVIWSVFTLQTQHAVTRNDSAKTTPDSQVAIDVLVNDFISSGTMTLSSVTQPDKGVASIKDNKVLYIPIPDFTGVVTFNYIVNAMDTGYVTVAIAATTTNPSNDHTPPVMQLIVPAKDSVSVNAPSATVSIEATDESGIDTVMALFASVNLQPSVSASTWSVTVNGLIPNEYTTVMFIAMDASGNNNMDTLFVTIKYDSLMSDETGPVIRQISGPVSGSDVTDPIVTIIDSITDPSGIDSVYWRLNNGPIKLLAAVSGTDQFFLTDSLLRTGLDTIVVTAVDNSTKRNRSVQTVVLNYVVPVKITEEPQSKEANESGSTTFSVKAEGDEPLTYQWFKNDTAITGTDNSAYTFSSIKATDDKSTFKCIVSNSFSKDTSTIAVLTVIVTPVYKVTFAVDGGTAVAEQSVKNGEKVIIPAANPTKEGFEFNGWYTSTAFSTAFDFTTQTITADVIIYAKWTKTYNLTIVNYPSAGGTSSKSPNTALYASGTVVTITANANAGYRFKNWSGDYSGTTNPAQITMTKDYTITANFLKQYTVSFSSTPLGRGNITTPATPSVVVDSGVAFDIVATPATGFKFKKWTSTNAGVRFVNSTAATTKLNITQDIPAVAVQAVFGCITFRKDFPTGYFPNSVAQADDGSYGVYCHLFTTTGDGVIIKLNDSGDSVWEKTVCHLGIYDESYPPLPIHKITNGFMAGVKVGSNPIYGISLDANSTPLFAWDPATDFNTIYSVQNAIQTIDGGYLLSGYEEQSNHKQMLIKTDAARKKVWMMYTDTLYGVKDCQQTLDNGFIMTDGNYRVVKINNTGTITNFSIKFSDITPNSVCQINETDGYLIGGSRTYSGPALTKLLPNGTIVSGWPKTYSTLSTYDFIETVRVTADGSYVFLTSEGNLIKTTSNGEIVWNKQLSSGGECLEICNDGGFIIITREYALKTDENGETE